MPDIDPRRFRKWEKAFAPHEKAISDFAAEKRLQIKKWYHDSPAWHIGKQQRIEDVNVVWWSIQLHYNEESELLSLQIVGWIDREYQTQRGRVRRRKLGHPKVIAVWEAGLPINIRALLEQAYKQALLITKKDLNTKKRS
jgi:hypothetical protein